MRQLAFTSLAFVGLGLGSLSVASAAVTSKETVVHETTTPVEIALNAQTVICSSADYSLTFLKVLIPELAKITLLNHQNIGAGAPCVASGVCDAEHSPSTIIDANNPTELVDITVKATRIDHIDDQAQTCTTSLKEQVDLVIRGTAFMHTRFADLGSRPYSDCVAASGALGDSPADDPGTLANEVPEAGGCAAGGGAGGAALLMTMLGGLVSLRRRKLA
ncbi:MAG: hypothetical protein AB7O24_13050 [Kofleriaceae bacterium]